MKKLVIAGLSVMMLAGCGNKTEQLEEFYTQIDTVNAKEKPVVEVNKNLQKLESEKVELFNKISKAKKQEIKVINNTATKLVKNASARSAAIDKEIKAYDESEAEFKKAKDLASEIKDKDQKKEASDLTNALEKKYKEHDGLMTAYKDVLKKENDLFKYLEGKSPETSEVNSKIENLNKSTSAFQKNMTTFNKTMEQVQKESGDIVKLLNDK
ncbi:YkyA family protein [Macrococcus brunensis]|nr:YkyA family protein [Macrococcus brunensis]ULG74994.1 YkyA family protein [Macrococcus brunensis]